MATWLRACWRTYSRAWGRPRSSLLRRNTRALLGVAHEARPDDGLVLDGQEGNDRVLGLQLGGRLGDDRLVAAHDQRQADTVGQAQIGDALAGAGALGRNDELHELDAGAPESHEVDGGMRRELLLDERQHDAGGVDGGIDA